MVTTSMTGEVDAWILGVLPFYMIPFCYFTYDINNEPLVFNNITC